MSAIVQTITYDNSDVTYGAQHLENYSVRQLGSNTWNRIRLMGRFVKVADSTPLGPLPGTPLFAFGVVSGSVAPGKGRVVPHAISIENGTSGSSTPSSMTHVNNTTVGYSQITCPMKIGQYVNSATTASDNIYADYCPFFGSEIGGPNNERSGILALEVARDGTGTNPFWYRVFRPIPQSPTSIPNWTREQFWDRINVAWGSLSFPNYGYASVQTSPIDEAAAGILDHMFLTYDRQDIPIMLTDIAIVRLT